MAVFKTTNGEEFKVYTASENDGVFMVDGGDRDYLVSDPALGFKGGEVVCAKCNEKKILSPLDHESAECLRKHFAWTAPSRVLDRDKTMGVGDRLGIAGDGHLRVFFKYPEIIPILAQQSIRELTLTNRTFADVLDSATFAVFRCGYKTGWGADGDHVKTAEEVEYALKSGFTMITLDCSEHIHDNVNDMSDAEVEKLYASKKDAELESLYLEKSFDVGEGISVTFDRKLFMKTVLIYKEAIDHAVKIWRTLICRDGVQVADFEISIDETLSSTLPEQHFFVANELARHNVRCSTVAPRFCGEFQKGVDYRGNLAQYEKEMKIHAAIARKFGYKISIHSGSDKFSIFKVSGRETAGRFHLKTAGTNWLEAVKLVAIKDPQLYREVHTYALEAFAEASKYYHVSTNLNNIPALSTLKDSELPNLFKNDDSRQLIHITYGLILNKKNSDGSYTFKDRLYKLWREEREEYYKLLDSHIGRHVAGILLK